MVSEADRVQLQGGLLHHHAPYRGFAPARYWPRGGHHRPMAGSRSDSHFRSGRRMMSAKRWRPLTATRTPAIESINMPRRSRQPPCDRRCHQRRSSVPDTDGIVKRITATGLRHERLNAPSAKQHFEVEVPGVRPGLASIVEQRYPTTADGFQLSPEDFSACAIGTWSIPREAVPTNHRLQRLMAFAAASLDADIQSMSYRDLLARLDIDNPELSYCEGFSAAAESKETRHHD